MAEAFHVLLKRARIAHSLSQKEVAEQLGTTSTNVSRWESGMHVPSLYYRRKLCELYGLPLDIFSSIQADDGAPAPALVLPEEDTPQVEPIFSYNTTLQHPEEFLGRTYEWRQLLGRARTGQPTAIIGPRRIGKSWLITYFCMQAQRTLGPHAHVVCLDASAPSCRTLLSTLATLLHEFHLPEPADKDIDGHLHALERGVRELRGKRQLPIVCIDKFDRMCQLPEMNLDILDRLRAITQIGLGMIVISREALSSVIQKRFGQSETSPFMNVFLQILLKPFTAQEAQQFVQTKGALAGFTEEEYTYLLRYGRKDNEQVWFPQRLQLAGMYLLQDKLEAQETNSSTAYRPHDPAYWTAFVQRIEAEMQETE